MPSENICVPANSNFKVTFSNNVDKESVISELAKQFSNDKEFIVYCSFINDKTLLIKFKNKENIKNSIVVFTLINAKDIHGCYIDDNDGYNFLLKNKRCLVKYKPTQKKEESIFSPKVIDTATLSGDCNYFVYTDFVRSIIDNGDVPNNSSFDSFLNIFSLENDKYIHIEGLKSCDINSPKYILYGNTHFFYNNSIYSSNGNLLYSFNHDIRNANFSPNENSIAISYVKKFPENKINTTNIDIFDLNKLSILNSYELESYPFDITTDQYDLATVDFVFVNSSTILFETKQKELKILDLSTKEIKNFIKGSFISEDKRANNCISPNKKNIIIENENETIIIDTTTKETIYKFKSNIKPKNIVWANNNSLYFNDNTLRFDEKRSDTIFSLTEDYQINELDILGLPLFYSEERGLFILKD